jgi:two-component system, NarL family, sensor kinase
MDSQETRIFMAIALTTILVGAVLLYLFILLYKQQRKNLKLQRQLALSEISSLEQERSRIAADLHDDLGPLLSAIKFRINSVSTDNKEDKEEINTSSKILDDAIVRLREISNNLLPTSLIRKGLIGAVEELVALHNQNGQLRIKFEYSSDINITQEKKIHLFRMTQEAIYNCLKHAEATRLLISLKQENGLLRLMITDNGHGMVNNVASSGGGRGLISLSNRASIMGGALVIHSEPNKGTILDFEIPV